MKQAKLLFVLTVILVMTFTQAIAGRGDGVNSGQQSNRPTRIIDEDLQSIGKNGASRFDRQAVSGMTRPTMRLPIDKSAAKTQYALGLSGTYSIPGDFANIGAAVAVLNFVGLSGNTTFELASASYLELAPVTFGAYTGAGTYTLTIQPAAATAVTVSFISTATEGKGFAFDGASGVTIDGLNTGGASLALGWRNSDPFPAGDALASTVYMTNGSSDISILNSTIHGNLDGTFEAQTDGRCAIFLFVGVADAIGNSDITISGNTIIDGTFGVKILAEDADIGQIEQNGITVSNNNFGGTYGGKLLLGIYSEFGTNLDITGNNFKGIEVNAYYWNNGTTEWDIDWVFAGAPQSFLFNFGQYGAIQAYYGDGNSEISNNYINGVTLPAAAGFGGGGIILGITARVTFAGTWLVYNNRVTNITNFDPSGGSITGMRTQSTRIYHNSVGLVGATGLGMTSTCLNQSGGTAITNNAFSNNITGGTVASTRGINVVAAGAANYNAIHSGSGRYVSGLTTITAALAAGVNNNGLYGPVNFSADLHIDTATVSSAKQIGKSLLLLADDIDGDPRDTTVAGKRDAGADEFSPLSAFLASDILPTTITSPPAGGVPAGVPQIPVVVVKNNSQTPVVSSILLTISVEGYSDSKPVVLAAGESKSITFASWTPVGAGPRVITAVTALADANIPNNTLIRAAQPVSAPVVPPATYTFNASAEGWTGAIDWKRSSTFTKLGGVNGGSGASWVTERPDNASTYTEGSNASAHGYATTYPGANHLESPWLDISGFAGTNLFISFQHSIELEPLWDRSWLQYTVDGTNWSTLGVLNDANGINWYDEALYEHAALDLANWDDATAALYGLADPPASWTSNDNGVTGTPGNGLPVGPTGYVYVQLKVTETSHAALVGASAVKFRYVAFSDASAAFGGWAFDNFSLGATAPVFTGGTIAGHAWNDVNGNGVDDGEADITATKVYISLFGSLIDSVVTSGTGNYTWSGVSLPAGYEVKLNVTGFAFTVPFGTSNAATINHPSNGSTITQNFGTFAGSISGKKYSDINDNGVNDAEPGLSGWTIEVHRDSTAGAFVGSDVTDGSGLYSILAPAYGGVFYVTEVLDTTIARQTGPVGGFHTANITGGTPTAVNKDFGNFVYGKLRVQLTVDQNGNGIRDVGDIIAVPSGSSSSFKLTKNGVGYTADSVFTLGNGVIAASFTELDLGTYVVQELDSIAGWRRTKSGLQGMIVATSGQIDTADYLDFKYLVISGTKFNDLNGNGVKEGGEPGLSGWTIAVAGGVYFGNFSTVTDGSGNYSIDSVFTGSHVVGEVVQSGWTRTMPSGPGTYAISGISGNFVVTTGKDFGNFDNTDVSGIVYRDYNGNGIMDGPDAAMSGVSVDLAVNGGIDVSDGSGYSFNGQIDVDTVRITVPVGFVISQPLAGKYPVALLSGGAATALNFGLFQTTDSSTKYRTFTAAQLGADAEKKPGKTPKAGKPYDPIKNKPNTANLVDQLIGKTGQAIGAIKVGLTGQFNAGGKVKAHVIPNKQSAFWKSLNNKSAQHTGMARGFDQDLKGKPFLKLQKAFAPNKKQNNKLFGELLALQLNLVASGLKTPAGLGSLIYSDPLSDFDGMTIDEIADYADTVMTNFEFMPLSIYAGLDTVVAKINGAFDNPATDDTLQGWASPKLTWKAYTSVYQVSYLKPNPGVAPKNRHAGETVDQVPTEFALSQNYPNPFNPTTTIEFELPQTSIVTLKVYNLLGQEVATLFDREEIELSETVEFDASSLPSGVYLYRIVAETIADVDAGIGSETFTQVKKMVLVK